MSKSKNALHCPCSLIGLWRARTDRGEFGAFSSVPPSDLLLRLGEHDLSVEEEPYGYEERRIQIVASHPQFDPRTFEYDLALLRFYEPVKFQPNIIPVCVPDDDSNFVGSSAYVTGWGRLYEGKIRFK